MVDNGSIQKFKDIKTLIQVKNRGLLLNISYAENTNGIGLDSLEDVSSPKILILLPHAAFISYWRNSIRFTHQHLPIHQSLPQCLSRVVGISSHKVRGELHQERSVA